MALKSAVPDKSTERRRHPRVDVAAAVLVSPNGHPHDTVLFDLSESGARIGLPQHFEHSVGALVRLYFPRSSGPMVIFAEVKRMAIDHLGVEFAEGQQDQVYRLMGELSESA